MMDMDEPAILSRSHSRASVSSRVARERDDLIKQLVIMGVNPDVAKLAAVKVEYRSLEAALDYIFAKGHNQLFTHDYVQGPRDVCYLCQEPSDKHNRRQRDSEDAKDEEQLLVMPQIAPQLMKEKSKNMAE